MRIGRNLFYRSLLASAVLLGLSGCEENALIFPEQIEVESPGSSDRGPVKQNTFEVILEDDELVRFDLSTVDTERIASVYFSHSREGVEEVTEVTAFDDLYVISNLPLDSPTGVTVWALGLDGKESKKHIYQVQPLPFPSDAVVKSLTFRVSGFSYVIGMTNTTKHDATVYYKLDNEATYTQYTLPVASINTELILPRLAIGNRTLTYYVTDTNGGQTDVLQQNFEIVEPEIIAFDMPAQKAGWTPWARHGYDTGFSAERAIDGTIVSGYEFVSGSNGNPTPYKISFTQTRITTDPNYRSVDAERPTGTHDLIVVKSATIYSGAVSWGVNPSMATVYGITEDDEEINLGQFTHPTQVTLTNPFLIDLSDNSMPLKAIRFDIVNSFTSPTATGMNINEIDLTGYLYQ